MVTVTMVATTVVLESEDSRGVGEGGGLQRPSVIIFRNI